MKILLVGLLLVVVATALPVPDANLLTPPAAIGRPHEKLVDPPPRLPPPCNGNHGDDHPPFEIVDEIPGPDGHPLHVIDMNPSEEDFFEPSDESDEDDYFSGEFGPEAIAAFCADHPDIPECNFDPEDIAAYCADHPDTPECSDDFEPEPPRVISPANPSIVNPALQPSIVSSGSAGSFEPISPLNPAQSIQLSNLSPLNPVDPLPVPLAPVDPHPLIPADPNPLYPVTLNPLPLNPVDPLPLNPVNPLDPVDPVSVDPLPVTLNPLDPLPLNSEDQATEIPLEQAIATAFQGSAGNAAGQSFGSLAFPQEGALFTPSASSADAVSSNLPSSDNSGAATPIDKRIGSQSRYTVSK